MIDDIEMNYELRSTEAKIFLLQLEAFDLAIMDAKDRGQTFVEIEQDYYQ